MTSRELVYKTLEFENTNGRVPRQLWTLPWAEIYCGDQLREIQRDFEDDIVTAPVFLKEKTAAHGDPYTPGEYTDDWGGLFINVERGIFGQAKEALVREDEWEDVDKIHIPVEQLGFDVQAVNDFCHNTDKFVLAGCLPSRLNSCSFSAPRSGCMRI